MIRHTAAITAFRRVTFIAALSALAFIPAPQNAWADHGVPCDGPKKRAEAGKDEVAAKIARLIKELRCSTKAFSWLKAKALADIGTPAVPALTKALGEPGDENGLVRETVADAFREMGAKADIFRKMGADARPAMLALLVALRDDYGETSWNAAHALPYFGAPAVPHLIEALSDDVHWVRWRAALALGSIEPTPVAAVPALTRALNDENSDVRLLSARALGNIGRAAKSAAPGLEKLRDDKKERVREEAAKALAQIAKHE